MEIQITDMNVGDAAAVLENLAVVMQCSAEHGDMPSEAYASVFELMGALASAIRRETEAAV